MPTKKVFLLYFALATTAALPMKKSLENYTKKVVPKIGFVFATKMEWLNNHSISIESANEDTDVFYINTGKMKKTRDLGLINSPHQMEPNPNPLEKKISSPDGSLTALIGRKSISIQNSQKKIIKTLEYFETDSIDILMWSPNSDMLFIIYSKITDDFSLEKRAFFSNIQNRKEITLPEKIKIKEICSAAWHPEKPLLALGLVSNTILFLDTFNNKVIHALANNAKQSSKEIDTRPQLISWSPNGDMLAVHTTDQELLLYEFSFSELNKQQLLYKLENNQLTNLIIKFK